MRPICKVCGIRYVRSKGKCKDNSPKWGNKCYKCNGSKYKNQRYKGKICELCGFVAIHPCQLDVDHIDGNSKNNSPENKQTLCANCHRLKTFKNQDHIHERNIPHGIGETMPYHTPHFACGCGKIYPLHNFMEQKDVHSSFACPVCGTLVEITIHVPKDLLIQDAVQKAQFEEIHGEVK